MSVSEGFKKVANEYLEAKQFGQGRGHPLVRLLGNELPSLLTEEAFLPAEYLVSGSAGKGNWGEIPWLAIFDREITTTARLGYYIVFLFRSDLSVVYLSLNQGWTQYEESFPLAEARLKIRENSNVAAQRLNSIPRNFSFDPIDLKASGSLGKGYELGHICGKKYEFKNFPANSDLLSDVRNMLGVYRELKGIIGQDILMLDKVEAQNADEPATPAENHEVQKAVGKQLSSAEIEAAIARLEEKLIDLPLKRSIRLASAIARNKKISDLVKQKAGYICQKCGQAGFEKQGGGLYAEAHHMAELGQGGLDLPSNLLCVCPTCHRKLHYGRAEMG